ncbi:54S ribosomal protein rml2, mitochondrial [Zancudomyces culisetae]|uniref:Large ribosomal subunit protein uL2m n=1 Tax=Zancudomyces culisetae TaxID=1213189 RepID=A0A1R1PRX0_ZANCU|nr:54S ribosomal protein rml2, mitochondrial [Zancudomyces culisetae]|eukprot:OMH83730.1 54S ribosomal protein rml2, mitochondrial [Zancudomyces culisetae]
MSVTKDDGQFKTWKPVTPGVRHKKMASRAHLWKGKPIRTLTVAKRRTGGRNNTGRITVRHRGGGAKRRIRLLDFFRKDQGIQEVVRLEYDPGRTAHIALLKHLETKKFSYILAPEGLKPGMTVQSYMYLSNSVSNGKNKKNRSVSRKSDSNQNSAIPNTSLNSNELQDDSVERMRELSNLTRSIKVEVGNCLPLKLIPPGSTIHSIGLHPGDRARLCRSAGASAQLLYTAQHGTAQIKLSSGEVRRIPVDCCATIGTVSNSNHKYEVIGTAGANRRRGWRPTVRGTAMNKHDHPNGGGRGKSRGGRQPTSPWGKLAKGGKTRYKLNPLVIRHRNRK